MNDLSQIIDFNKLTPQEFEELCFEFILKLGFSNVTWNRGGADSGRDIEAYASVSNNLLGFYNDRFFIECKHHEKGVPPEKLTSKVAWADAEKPDHLVLLVSSYLTEKSRLWLEKIEKDKTYKIHVLEGKQLKSLISLHDDLVEKFFPRSDSVTLLNETKKNWLKHSLEPSLSTVIFLIEQLNLDVLPASDLAFLHLLFCSNYPKIEGFDHQFQENQVEDYVEHLEHLEDNLIKCATTTESVLAEYSDYKILSYQGCITLSFDKRVLAQYNFMATHILVNDPPRLKLSRLRPNVLERQRFGIYVFKRLKNKAIEILLFRDSNFEVKIRYIENYSFGDFKDAVLRLNLWAPLRAEVLKNSKKMK